VTKEKIRVNITKEEAADRLTKIAEGLRAGSVALEGLSVAVANDVELKAQLRDDELEVELKWRRAGV
jgi:amphi-Trp domain-containing protein